MNVFNKIALVILIVVITFGLIKQTKAVTAVSLGTADNFVVLGSSTITNTGPSVVNGNLGLSPGTSVTGFPPGIVNGVQHITDGVALQAQADLVTAYNNVAGQTPVSTVATELGGTTKIAGVYDSATGTFGITGTLTLDAQGNPNAVFIFKTASTLITAVSSNIILTNGAQACNVFWQVGSSATLGTNSTFKGNILALQSVTVMTGANVEGRVLARNGAVTLDISAITKATCTVSTPTPTATPTPSVTPTPTVTPTPSVTPTTTPTPTPVPGLPNTGIGPNDSDSSSVNTIILTGILISLGLFYLARKKQII